MTAKTGLKPFMTTTLATVEAEVDVEIEADDLHDAGWHHDSECKGVPVTTGFGAVIASLHRQAHPGQHREVMYCHEEPCRSLTLEQLQEVDGA